MKRFFHSFNGRLLLSIVGVHIMLVPLLLFGVYLIAKPGVERQFVNQVRSDALLFGNLIGSRLTTGDTAEIAALMGEFLLNGRLIFAEVQMGDRIIPPNIPLATQEPFNEDFFFGQHEDGIYFIAVPLTEGDAGGQPVLRLGYDEIPVRQELMSLYRRGIYLVASYLGLTLIVVALLGRRLVRPLEILRREADQITAGDHGTEFGTRSGIAEVAALAENLERMRQGLIHARDAALQAALTKSEFLANMSHEIRTPMNGVIGMLELALRTELTPQQKDYLTMASSSAESLLRLLNDILDFSKIEARKLELECIQFDLRDAVGDTLKLLAPQAHAKGLELTYLIDPQIPDIVSGDVGRLRQILINLVSNAIKFTPQGEIVVRVESGCDRCADSICPRFSVSDTGVGIPADKQTVIFDAFTQADASSTRMFGGTGLGLAISSRLVNLMRGDMGLESEVGRGSTFYFTVPLKVPSETAPGPRQRSFDLHGVKVLVVDDHPVNRYIFMEMLTQWGMSPVQADSGKAALHEIQRATEQGAPFRLILLDAMMPEMDGFEVAAHIKATPSTALTTIMLLSSADRGGDFELSRRLGISRFLRKPVKYSELMEAIQAALDESEATPVTPEVLPASPFRAVQRGLRILVAEDNPVNQRLVQALLEDRGHSVLMAGNGEEALRLLERESFDAVLMDVQMPVMDGLQATAAIRERERDTGRHAYIVAMTAHALKGDKERCLAAGMDAYVSKPIREAELLAAVERWNEEPASSDTQGASAMSSDQPPFDLSEALARVRNRRPLLRSMAEIFIGQSDDLLDQCEAAIESADGPTLERAAHTLKSSAASFCAATVSEIAQRLENAGRTAEFGNAKADFQVLKSEMGRLLPALKRFLDEPDPPA